ncbi:exported hypothetical protein [metagenome]|uniref:Lipoprotein n=1 Tax=metagenome TaxID=256318 RepID=A0A2P2C0Q6_9ZZZZ
MRRPWAAFVVCASLLVTAACADDGTRSSSALRTLGDDPATMCSPTSGTASGMTVSIEGVRNRSEKPVTVVKAELTNAVQVRVLGISALGQDSTTPFGGFGSWSGYPPRGLPTEWRAAWKRREPAEGAVIPPQHGRDEYTGFVIGYAAVRGSAGPLRITYKDGDGRQGSVEMSTILTTSPHCRGPFPGYQGFGRTPIESGASE